MPLPPPPPNRYVPITALTPGDINDLEDVDGRPARLAQGCSPGSIQTHQVRFDRLRFLAEQRADGRTWVALEVGRLSCRQLRRELLIAGHITLAYLPAECEVPLRCLKERGMESLRRWIVNRNGNLDFSRAWLLFRNEMCADADGDLVTHYWDVHVQSPAHAWLNQLAWDIGRQNRDAYHLSVDFPRRARGVDRWSVVRGTCMQQQHAAATQQDAPVRINMD